MCLENGFALRQENATSWSYISWLLPHQGAVWLRGTTLGYSLDLEKKPPELPENDSHTLDHTIPYDVFTCTKCVLKKQRIANDMSKFPFMCILTLFLLLQVQ